MWALGNSELYPAMVEVEAIDCNPGMCAHPMALLRWFQLYKEVVRNGVIFFCEVVDTGAIYFLLQWLVQITCGSDACTMIMNVFGYTAMGQERVYAILGIVLFIVAGILGTWMAVLTNNPEVNYQGRGKLHIRGQWIAAAVFEFLMALLFIGDFLLQRRESEKKGRFITRYHRG
ncbi:hypothetical protein ANCCEY_04137 [Ancylostoma ceylanicum]|uniref:Uncharacterized protein n=1 Tax=Ancylostoma ceylanicum TaxID=53326 RepID=A0A0D6LXL3_9BILA|nr:hypothetical protein ANCCEY_04137 [Ancylostoma ceylanicum]